MLCACVWQTVRCNGSFLLDYKQELVAVLHATLHLKCQDGAELAGNLLRHILKALTLTYACDYRSSPEGWDRPLDAYLPIRVSAECAKLRGCINVYFMERCPN